MAFVHYLKKPELRNPVVVAAFAGWNDAADAATTAVKFLIDRWKPLKFAEIEAEEFYVFTETRPTISAKKGVLRAISWPSNHFLSLITPQFERDIILYLGVEPQLKWKTFSSSYLDVCKRFNVSEVLLLGAFLANIPHSIDVPISGFSSDSEKLDRLLEIDVHSTRYEGPTGMVGVLHDTLRRANIPVSSLWAAAPHYLAATPNIKVTAALLTHLNTFLSFNLDLGDIQADAQRFEEQITMLVERDPEASAYVHKLEEQVSEISDDEVEHEDDEDEVLINPDKPVGTGTLPSADSLIRSVEELLRKEREINDQIVFWTYAKSQKIVNLRRDDRLTCLVETGERYSELRGVQIKGRAIISNGYETVRHIGAVIWERYNGSLNDTSRQMVAAQAAKRVLVFVEPVEIVSWDHRKLDGGY